MLTVFFGALNSFHVHHSLFVSRLSTAGGPWHHMWIVFVLSPPQSALHSNFGFPARTIWTYVEHPKSSNEHQETQVACKKSTRRGCYSRTLPTLCIDFSQKWFMGKCLGKPHNWWLKTRVSGRFPINQPSELCKPYILVAWFLKFFGCSPIHKKYFFTATR